MNKHFTYTLRAEGNSDRLLMPILDWVLQNHLPKDVTFAGQFVDWFQIGRKPESLALEIQKCFLHFPSDLLFIHRDADDTHPDHRRGEIEAAIETVRKSNLTAPVPHVCIIPVQESEAWLLIEEDAIRKSVANPRGSIALKLPKLTAIETTAKPKELLRSLMLEAAEATGRKRKKIAMRMEAIDVSRFITDYSLLRKLQAFQDFERELQEVVQVLTKS